MAHYKLKHLEDGLVDDLKVAIKHYGLDKCEALGLGGQYRVFYQVCANRAYDDLHPRWAVDTSRFLPYDGRDYCWYYVETRGVNDDHVSTWLKHSFARAIKELKEEQK